MIKNKIEKSAKIARPFVVGAPRTGFSLLIHVVSHLLPLKNIFIDRKQAILNELCRVAGISISKEIEDIFIGANLASELIYNQNFKELLGGPKWLDQDNNQRACIRKYIGVKGLGDFTLLTSHPAGILDYYDVVHSHYFPKSWCEHEHYSDYTKFASVRSPIDTINSSCFSINALASEYIQKYVADSEDNDELRNNLALYKLTDLDFFEGLIRPLKDYFIEFLSCRNDYKIMKWENLITNPCNTIKDIANGLELSIDDQIASSIWTNMQYKNLTGSHKHNYRKGHAEVSGWKLSLTNEHLDILKEEGMEEICRELGYGDIQFLDESRYTNYQKQTSNYIKQGKIYNDFKDKDLFNFAFNKSNLDSSKFSNFKSYEWKSHTRIERSSFTDESLLMKVWEKAEESISHFNDIYSVIDKYDYENEAYTLNDFKNELSALKYKWGKRDLIKNLSEKFEHPVCSPPRLIVNNRRHNVVSYSGKFYLVPKSIGTVDISDESDRNNSLIKCSDDFNEIRNRMSGNTFNKAIDYFSTLVARK